MTDPVTTDAILVREVVTTDYSGDHSVKETQKVSVKITWLGEAKTDSYQIAGEWRVLQ